MSHVCRLILHVVCTLNWMYSTYTQALAYILKFLWTESKHPGTTQFTITNKLMKSDGVFGLLDISATCKVYLRDTNFKTRRVNVKMTHIRNINQTSLKSSPEGCPHPSDGSSASVWADANTKCWSGWRWSPKCWHGQKGVHVKSI